MLYASKNLETTPQFCKTALSLHDFQVFFLIVLKNIIFINDLVCRIFLNNLCFLPQHPAALIAPLICLQIYKPLIYCCPVHHLIHHCINAKINQLWHNRKQFKWCNYSIKVLDFCCVYTHIINSYAYGLL